MLGESTRLPLTKTLVALLVGNYEWATIVCIALNYIADIKLTCRNGKE